MVSVEAAVAHEWEWIFLPAVLLAIVVPIGAVVVAVRARRAARRDGLPSAALASVALLLVRVALGVALLAAPLLADRFVDGLMWEYFPGLAEQDPASWSVRAGPWLVVLLILLLAEVWRYGIQLQKEAEGVV